MHSMSADIVVIGGGSSGAVVAARCVEAGHRVILVEAGPDYGSYEGGRWPADLLDAHTIATSHDWNYGSGPVSGRNPWTFERARVIGGCSAHNGAIAAVGHAADYDAWNLAGWQTDDLRPLFKTALKAMRVRTYTPEETGPFHARCLQAAKACGWRMAEDLDDLDANDSFGLESVNIVNRVRWNTAFAYIDPLRKNQNLTIIDNMLVDRISEMPACAMVEGWRDGQRIVVAAEQVVLAAGVYGSPAILQRSGIGDPDRLRAIGVTPVHDLPGVGSNLHDHPMIHADRTIGPALREWLNEAAALGQLPEEQTLGKALSTKATDGIFDLHLFPVCASTQTTLTGGHALIEVACVTPKSRGRIDITSSDPAAHPIIDHSYLSDEEEHDISVLRDGLMMAEELFNTEALASILGNRVTELSDDASIRRHVAHYYHPVGTCKMGTGPDAVCDAKGRVRGMQRLTVGDVSLMPQIPRANTNIPAVVIGEKIAEFLGS